MTLPTPSVARKHALTLLHALHMRRASPMERRKQGATCNDQLWVKLRKIIYEVYEEPFVWYEYQRLVTTC